MYVSFHIATPKCMTRIWQPNANIPAWNLVLCAIFGESLTVLEVHTLGCLRSVAKFLCQKHCKYIKSGHTFGSRAARLFKQFCEKCKISFSETELQGIMFEEIIDIEIPKSILEKINDKVLQTLEYRVTDFYCTLFAHALHKSVANLFCRYR
jgi:hypothetical protein